MSCFLLNVKAKACSSISMFVRHGHRLRGKPPGVAKTLSQRLEDENREDSELSGSNDIGLPFLRPPRSIELRQRLEHQKAQERIKISKSSPETENIDLEATKNEWLNTAGPFHIRRLGEHYGVFNDLFGKYAYFTPRVQLDIKFLNNDASCPVYYGNRIKPSDAKTAPEVKFNHKFGGDENSLWTLLLTNPDGHLTEENKEYVHWMVSNIPAGDVTKGKTVVPYLQPIPPKGSGYHRHVFILFKQEKQLNLDEFAVKEASNLPQRTFNTLDFYRQRQDDITPAGLAFFQADWDQSLTDFYHNVLAMKEPVYDYDYPEAYINEPVAFPHRQPFNIYLDRYADPKDVNKRFLQEKLANTDPFEGPKPSLRFPNAHFHGNEPSWLKTEVMKKRLRWGRINDVEK